MSSAESQQPFALAVVRANTSPDVAGSAEDVAHRGNLVAFFIVVLLIYADGIDPEIPITSLPLGLAQSVLAVLSDNYFLAVEVDTRSVESVPPGVRNGTVRWRLRDKPLSEAAGDCTVIARKEFEESYVVLGFR